MIAFSAGARASTGSADTDDSARPVPVVVYLSGPERGTTLRVTGDTLRIGTDPDLEIRVQSRASDRVCPHHATLFRSGETFHLVAQPDCAVWVNGRAQSSTGLKSGDLLEIGRNGGMLRFRLYPAHSAGHKTLAEIFGDCVDCARYSGRGPLGKASVFLGRIPRALIGDTSAAFRGGVVAALAVMAVLTTGLVRQNSELQERLDVQTSELGEVRDLLEATRRESMTPDELSALLSNSAGEGGSSDAMSRLDELLARSNARIEALEDGANAGARVAALAARSTALVLGSYGFERPRDGERLRVRLGPNGRPITGSDGQPAVTFGGEGPEVLMQYTGTAFLVSEDGLMVTNRHVAVPWDYEPTARRLVSAGLRPVLERYAVYVPGHVEPFDLQVVDAGTGTDGPDIALVKTSTPPPVGVTPLTLSSARPELGQEVFLVGYPMGIRAIVARSGSAFIESLRSEGGGDMWRVADRLSSGGLLSPLITRGIVGQVTPEAITYDAQTTSGGSGGPVLDRNGRVIAVNMAVLPGYGGSNLGVPVNHVRSALTRAGADVHVPSGGGPPR